MLRIKKYVIRHKPTGYFIPVPYHSYNQGKDAKPRSSARGSSFVEPRPEPYLIRLFPSLRSATAFLAIWLKGQHIGEDDGEGYTYVGKVKPVASRIKSEMEIIEAYMDILT